MADPRRLVVVQEALKAAALDSLALLGRDETIRRVVAALAVEDLPQTPRESAAAARQACRVAMLAELARHEGEGRGRDAPMMVAKKYAADPLDGVEVSSLARSLRRWRAAMNPDSVHSRNSNRNKG